MDISKDDEEKNPMYFVNPIIKNKDTSTKLLMKKAVCLFQINLLKLIDQVNVKLNI